MGLFELSEKTPYIIWGYGFLGTVVYNKLRRARKYDLLGFADNNPEKSQYYVAGTKIRNIKDCQQLLKEVDYKVIIASNKWAEIGLQLEAYGIPVVAIFAGNEIKAYSQKHFEDIDYDNPVVFYAGEIVDDDNLKDPKMIGVCINKGDDKHILHDITNPFPVENESIDGFIAEHVLEHIEYSKLVDVINEIYRILKPGATLRICLPDYNSKYLRDQVMTNEKGIFIFDANGGGTYKEGIISGGGHVWFPDIDNVKRLIEKTNFDNYAFLCYRTEQGQLVRNSFNNDYLHLCRANKSLDDELFIDMIVDCQKAKERLENF